MIRFLRKTATPTPRTQEQWAAMWTNARDLWWEDDAFPADREIFDNAWRRIVGMGWDRLKATASYDDQDAFLYFFRGTKIGDVIGCRSYRGNNGFKLVKGI